MLIRLIRGLFANQAGENPRSKSVLEGEFDIHAAVHRFKRQDYQGAMEVCERLLQVEPRHFGALNLRAAIAMELGERKKSKEYFDAVLTAGDESPQALCNAAEANRQAGDIARAIELAERACQLAEDCWPAWHILALALQMSWRMDEARAVLERISTQAPGLSQAYATYLFHLILVGESPLRIRAEQERWASINVDSAYRVDRAHSNSKDGNRRLRVGYVSGDLREHPIAGFVEPILEAHDRTAFEIFCYSNTGNEDHVTSRIRNSKVTWRNIRHLPDEEAAARIQEDSIDILVDLSGHTLGNRLGTFALQPAPVQMTFLSCPGTTGMKAMGYKLTDSIVDPPGVTDEQCTERLVRLPRCQWSYQPDPRMPAVASLPLEKTGTVSFGSLNSMIKLTPEVIGLWSSLLKLVRGSRLVIASAPAGTGRARLVLEFSRNGVEEDRLHFQPPLSLMEYWELHGQIDIALDSHPYNGGTTTCVALWLGVPVITIAGNLMGSRCGASILHEAGLDEFIADSKENFLQIAAALAHDVDKLSRLRAGMRGRLKTSRLLDTQGFTMELEKVYRSTWQDWCQHANL